MESVRSENDGMETAIEPFPPPPLARRRPRNLLERIMMGVVYWVLVFTSENAFAFYVLIHWLLGCIIHIAFSGPNSDENVSFLSFIYFMSSLGAFLSIMSHTSGLMIPLFAFCGIGAVFIFVLINIAILEPPGAQDYFREVCERSNATKVFYDGMVEHPTGTMVKAILVISFFVVTCATILFQVTRNEEEARRPQAPLPAGYYPHMLAAFREAPIGATNLDEPPRYSTLERMTSSPKPATHTTSSITSPPRYSYWERTFGRNNRDRTASQSSEHSNRDMITAKSH